MRAFGTNCDGRLLLLVAAFALTIAAMIGFHLIRDQHVANAVAIVDITGSMNARDMGNPIGSESRLEAVHQALVGLIQNLPCQSQIGLGLFTERISFLLFNPVEVCGNYDALESAFSDINWRMAWQADSYIAKGLYSAIDIASSIKSDLIFLTDGHEAPPLPYTGTPPFSGKPGDVKGLIVGVGGQQKSPIPKYDEDGRQVGVYGPSDVPQDNRIGQAPPGADKREGYNPRNAPFGAMPEGGDEHLSSVKTAHLKDLAQQTGLTYVELQKTPGLASPLLASTSIRTIATSTNMGYVPAFIALLLMVLLYGLSLMSDPRFSALGRPKRN
jgi:mxaL protein